MLISTVEPVLVHRKVLSSKTVNVTGYEIAEQSTGLVPKLDERHSMPPELSMKKRHIVEGPATAISCAVFTVNPQSEAAVVV